MRDKQKAFSAKRLRAARGERKVAEVAFAAGVTERTVLYWESGKGEPDATPLSRIADLTGKPMDFFFERVA